MKGAMHAPCATSRNATIATFHAQVLRFGEESTLEKYHTARALELLATQPGIFANMNPDQIVYAVKVCFSCAARASLHGFLFISFCFARK